MGQAGGGAAQGVEKEVKPRRPIRLTDSSGDIRPLGEIDADVIRLALKLYSATEAARRLGIGRSTLYRKMAEMENNGL